MNFSNYLNYFIYIKNFNFKYLFQLFISFVHHFLILKIVSSIVCLNNKRASIQYLHIILLVNLHCWKAKVYHMLDRMYIGFLYRRFGSRESTRVNVELFWLPFWVLLPVGSPVGSPACPLRSQIVLFFIENLYRFPRAMEHRKPKDSRVSSSTLECPRVISLVHAILDGRQRQ